MLNLIKNRFGKKNKVGVYGTAHIEINFTAYETIKSTHREEIRKAEVVYFESELLTREIGLNKKVDQLLMEEAIAQGKEVKYLESNGHAIGLWGLLVMLFQWTTKCNRSVLQLNEEMLRLFARKDYKAMRKLSMEVMEAPDFYLTLLRKYVERDKGWKKPKEKNAVVFVGAMHQARLDRRWN